MVSVQQDPARRIRRITDGLLKLAKRAEKKRQETLGSSLRDAAILRDALSVLEYQERAIAEQKARIEELEGKVSGLREGLEDIKSMRRIANLTDMMEECDFYLNRDA